MKVVKSLLISVILFTLLVSGARAQADGDVVVRGTISNHTPGGKVPFGETVTLQFFEEGTWTSIYTSTVRNDSTFLFSDLETELGNDFVSRIVYGEAEYFSEPAVLEGESDIEILIFESTDDASFIQVDQAHYFIVPTEDTFQVAEFYLVGNTGDKTYIGSMAAGTSALSTVNFTLPTDAINITFDGPGLGERFVGDEKKFADTRAVPPGNATIEVSFVYDVIADIQRTIERVMEIPVASVVFIVSGGKVGLEGSGLEFTGIMDTQMGPAASYTAGPLAAFESLSFTFVPLMEDQSLQAPVSSPSAPVVRTRNAGTETGIGVVVLVVAGLVAYQIWQAPGRTQMPEDTVNLVKQAAELDHQYDQAIIDQATYQTQRAALKHQIKALLVKK